jgi:hypothetical protein
MNISIVAYVGRHAGSSCFHAFPVQASCASMTHLHTCQIADDYELPLPELLPRVGHQKLNRLLAADV